MSQASERYSFLEPHAQVISRLMNGVSFLMFCTPSSELLWHWGVAPDRGGRAAMRALLAEEEAVWAVPCREAQWVVKFPIGPGTAAHEAPGSCVVLIEGLHTRGAPELTTLHGRIAPALTCVGRALATADPYIVRTPSDEVVEWLLGLEKSGAGGGVLRERAAKLIATASRYLGCCAARLFIPESGVDEASFASASDRSIASSILERLGRPVLTQLNSRGSGILMQAPATTRPASFKLLAVAIPDRTQRFCGVALFLRDRRGPDFSPWDQLTADAFARRTGVLLEARDGRASLLNRTELRECMLSWGDSEPPEACHCIVYIHVDGLEAVNEALGFDTADELIEQIAGLLRSTDMPADALAARLSGHLFVLALPRTDMRSARRYARTLQHSVDSLQRQHPSELRIVTLSCGLAAFRSPKQDFPNVLGLAEIASKTARTRGGSRIEVYEDTDSSMTRRRLDVITLGRFQHLLQADRLTLYAQRIEPLQRSGGPNSYELLLRVKGESPAQDSTPAALLSAARRYRLETEIDLWVLKHALASAARFQTALLETEIGLCINVCGPSISEPTFMRRARHWLRASGVPPALIAFEITETEAVSNLSQARRFIRSMQEMGCRFALDDFGTGVNSLKYLKELPVDRVKIDGSFITDLLTNTSSLATVKAIAALTKELGIETVAEFATSAAIIERLRELGITYAQGYAVEPPGPLAATLERIRAQHLTRLERLTF